MRTRITLITLLVASGALHGQTVTGPLIQFKTNLGNINVQLLPASAPKTVANFLAYVNSGAYNNSIIHRSVPNFVFQGGGYYLVGDNPVAIQTNAPVVNEYSVPNTRGTIAMAKTGGDPNSATSQWFFNEIDNSSTLGPTNNGGYTVFGQVADPTSLTVMDAIAAVPVAPPLMSDTSPPVTFDELPLINYNPTTPPVAANFVTITEIVQLATTSAPAIAGGGVVTASSFGDFAAASPGSFVEIYGSNLAGTTRGWASSDFTNGVAPTTLDNVTVTVGGVPAYVDYVSPAQVNIQIPANAPIGSSEDVVVTYNGTASAASSIPINATEPGLLAPLSFKINGTQYAAAVLPNGLFVNNGNIPNTSVEFAHRGDILVFYGVGFGPVTDTSVPVAGEIVSGMTQLANPVQFTIGKNVAQVLYAGFVPGLVGLYQFNVVVPTNSPSGDLPVQVTLNGTAVPQSLFVSVQ